MSSPAEPNKEDRINVVSRGDNGLPLRDTPLSLRDIPRVVEKSVNSVSAFGAKSSVHSLSPPLPIEPANAGLRRGPQLGELLAYTRKSLPCKGRCRLRRQRGSCRTKCRRTPPLSLRDIPRVVEKSVNSVSAFGAKSSVHFLAPPLPTKPATLGFGGAPIGVRNNTVGSPLGGRMRWKLAAAQQAPLRQNRRFCHLPLQGRQSASLTRGFTPE